MTTSSTFADIKTKQLQTWSSGNYNKIAQITVPLAETLVSAVDPSPGSLVLDVATGTGHVALAAARRFSRATGIDFVSGLVAIANRRAEAEGLEVEFREADAEDLPFPHDSFDYVLSAIGVMFTSDHQRAADELLRVCKPGGRVGIASWTPTGFVGQLLKTVGKHAPPPAGALPPTRWGTEDTMSELLGDRVSDLAFTTAVVTQRFPTPEFFADFFITHYGPTNKAAGRLSESGRREFRDDLISLAEASNRSTDGTVTSDWEYLIAIATKN